MMCKGIQTQEPSAERLMRQAASIKAQARQTFLGQGAAQSKNRRLGSLDCTTPSLKRIRYSHLDTAQVATMQCARSVLAPSDCGIEQPVAWTRGKPHTSPHWRYLELGSANFLS